MCPVAPIVWEGATVFDTVDSTIVPCVRRRLFLKSAYVILTFAHVGMIHSCRARYK